MIGQVSLFDVGRLCAECGSWFEPDDPKVVACSPECKLARKQRASRDHARRNYKRSAGMPPKPCARCGEVFEPYRSSSLFCGRLCQRLDRQDRRSSGLPPTRSCHKCGRSGLPPKPGKPVCDECKVDPRANQREKEAARRLRSYGLTQETYDAMWVAQGERCAVCRTDTPTSRGWCIDHDHVTGDVRGILCSQCNSAAGMLADSAVLSMCLADYLARFNQSESWWGDRPARHKIVIVKRAESAEVTPDGMDPRNY